MGIVCKKHGYDHSLLGNTCTDAPLVKPDKADMKWARREIKRLEAKPVAKVKAPRQKTVVIPPTQVQQEEFNKAVDKDESRHGKYKDEAKRKEYLRLKNKEYRDKRKNRKEKP